MVLDRPVELAGIIGNWSESIGKIEAKWARCIHMPLPSGDYRTME